MIGVRRSGRAGLRRAGRRLDGRLPASTAKLRRTATTNAYAAPERCPRCEHIEVRFIAFVPARVKYEGKRADKAQTSVELHDPGFHGYRVDCKDCGKIAERAGACPICESPAPIRARFS